MVAAALDAWRSRQNTGSLSCGLHHARRAQGAAFCTFNGLVLAAHAVLAAGVKRVLILDLDAHGGGGTHDILGTTLGVIHVDISTCSFDRHPAKAPSSYRFIGDAGDYLPTVQSRLDAVLADGTVDLQREELVFAWGRKHGVPISFVLAGGYLNRGTSRTQV